MPLFPHETQAWGHWPVLETCVSLNQKYYQRRRGQTPIISAGFIMGAVQSVRGIAYVPLLQLVQVL